MSKQTIQATVKTAPAAQRAVVAAEAFRGNEELLTALQTTPSGLDEEQISERLHRDGLNEVSHEKPPHWALQLLRAFKNPFIIVLLLLAVVEIFAAPDDLSGPIIIAVMVSVSVLLNFSQEYRSSRSAENLKAMVRNTAAVTRKASDGHSEQIEVPVVELVVGDIVHLAAGDMVPAERTMTVALGHGKKAAHAIDAWAARSADRGAQKPFARAVRGAQHLVLQRCAHEADARSHPAAVELR